MKKYNEIIPQTNILSQETKTPGSCPGGDVKEMEENYLIKLTEKMPAIIVAIRRIAETIATALWELL